MLTKHLHSSRNNVLGMCLSRILPSSPKEKVEQICGTFFSGDSLRGAKEHIADRFGVSTYTVSQTLKRLAAAAVRCQERVSEQLLSRLIGFVRGVQAQTATSVRCQSQQPSPTYS